MEKRDLIKEILKTKAELLEVLNTNQAMTRTIYMLCINNLKHNKFKLKLDEFNSLPEDSGVMTAKISDSEIYLGVYKNKKEEFEMEEEIEKLKKEKDSGNNRKENIVEKILKILEMED